MKYGRIDLGQIEAFINIIGGEKSFINLLRGKLVVVPRDKELAIWTTIKVGTGLRTLEDFLQAFSDNRKHMSNSLRSKLVEQRFIFHTRETEGEIDLCVDTVFNLTGLSQSPIYHLHNCITEIGGELCDTEIALQLRLQDDCIKTAEENYYVAMPSVWVGGNHGDGYRAMFYVNNRKTDTPPVSPLRLDPWEGGSNSFLDGDKKVVFVKPRPTVSDLYHKWGTFTGSKRVVDQLLSERKIWKEGNTLHVDLRAFPTACPMCSFGESIDRIKFLVNDLKKFFKVDEVVFHHERTSGLGEYTLFDATNIQHRGENDSCNAYPEIKGIGMRWEITVSK